jgi:hypothetical protein
MSPLIALLSINVLNDSSCGKRIELIGNCFIDTVTATSVRLYEAFKKEYESKGLNIEKDWGLERAWRFQGNLLKSVNFLV